LKIIPRVYQKLATKVALKGLRGRLKRALVVLATGLGKTLTAAFIMKEFRPKRVLFLVHNNFILDHAIGEFRLVFSEKLRIAIFNGLSKNGAAEADMVFATWQTMGKNLGMWKRNHFDLIIVDEAHHAEADTYLPVVKYFTGAKLGITATPDREDDADIRNTFGAEVIDISLEEAIARGWLPRIEYHVVTDESLDDESLQQIVAEIRESKRRFTMAEVNRRVFIRKRDQEIARIIGGYSEKTIVFCPSVKYAGRMKRLLQLSEVVHSKAGKHQKETWDKNQATLASLKNGTVRRICVVDAVNEGVNVPTVGLIAFCRATGTIRIFRQQLGRGCRPGKDRLIVLDFVGNLERIQMVLEMMNRISDLHEQYTPLKERKREGYTRQRFEVSGQGFEFTFSDKVVDLMKVLEHCEREFYPTWQEASGAAVKLGITTPREYKKRYKMDERLPSNPNGVYKDFPGFVIFLGRKPKKFYPTWQEASRAAIKLRIPSQSEYHRRYKEDNRLPGNLEHAYPDFPGFRVFLGGNPKGTYPTWQEASRAAIKLGIRTKPAYRERYKEDNRLPASPGQIYSDFPGFPVFFARRGKFYETWRQASKATIKLGISSRKEYERRYKEDRRLPSTPNDTYSDFPGMDRFLNGGIKKFYSTWEEASRATIRLGISGQIEYVQRRREDVRLPSNPNKIYPDFPGYPIFLGKKNRGFYPTWQEASRAAIKLGISSQDEYNKRYKEDSRLPSDPYKKYANFPGLNKFLGIK
jgi:superfamily II DNA or RNA helicase